jgi:hypothetical protein
MMTGEVNQQTGGIEKRMTWKLMFFVAATCVLAAGVIAVADLMFKFPPAPMSFMSEVFLLFFGIIMTVLDLPFGGNSPRANMIRDSIYKYMLFLTRFTGRGLWYCFLGTMIWSALFDLNISWFLGFILGLYVILLGVGTMFKGIKLSMKLDLVRKQITDRDLQVPPCPEKGFSKQTFWDLVNSVDSQKFSEDDIDYVINALSFSPENHGVITKVEYTYWLAPGNMSIV